MKEIFVTFTCIVLLTGCGTFNHKPESNHIASTILENNKENLTTIKNKTADDLELGYKVRTFAKKEMTNEELASKIRVLIAKQEGGTSNAQFAVEIRNKTSEINNRLNTVILIIVVLILVIVISNVLIVLRIRRNERVAIKPISKLGNKTADD